jgi:arylsulfatase A-like enzyme
VSDHGDMAGDHGLFWKRSFYEASVKVPMIWYPAVQMNGFLTVAEGIKIDVPVSLVDLAPTLISLSESPELPNLDGQDLSPLIQKQTDPETMEQWKERPVYSELIIPNKSPARMIRYKEYKLIYYHGYSSPQLFHVNDDPDEKHDLSRSSSHQEIKEELLSKLLDNWNAEEFVNRRESKFRDLMYLKLWGSEVGMGRLDLWNDENTHNQAR